MSDKNLKNQIQISTASKPSTAQDTNSAKNKGRWFRYVPKQPELPELDHILDLYWGGPERRITSLTLKIISVNMIALIMLLFGVLYLGKYQNSIIETKLENFEREARIISLAINEMDLTNPETREKVLRIIDGTDQEVKIFDKNANLIFTKKSASSSQPKRKELNSIKILKNTAGRVVSLLPDAKIIPYYPEISDDNVIETPDLDDALSGFSSLSAWQDSQDEIILSAGFPIIKNNETRGALVIIRQGRDIKAAIGEVWRGIIKIFLATLLVTIILSIFLAGAIAKPLKKLANAAEAVRTGRATGEDIPDLSKRHDEIGDLSVVLRSMTDALWSKMDSIESFAADVSHELKNPLTSLKSAIETLEKVKDQKDREKLLSIINHDIERMDRLITDISSASRLDAELSREAFILVEINTIIAELLEPYKNPTHRKSHEKNTQTFTTKDQKHIRLVTNNNNDCFTKAAPNRLQQVFHNLIDNALSFSKENDTVTITINRGEKLIAIHIDDEGPGIPENKLETIFDRFYTERPEEFYGQNSGLGLSICKQIIESHRGEIFAENRRNKKGDIIGARFNVILKVRHDG